MAAPVFASAATSCGDEQEPNAALTDLSSAVTGAFCMRGVAGPSDQDLILWTLDPEGAQSLWSFVLEGLPGQTTLLGLAKTQELPTGTSAIDGLPFDSSVTPPIIWQSGVNSTGVIQSPYFRLAPGTYVVGVVAQQNDMVWRIKAQSKAPPQLVSPDSAAAQSEFTLTLVADANAPSLRWTVSETDAAKLWRLDLAPALATSADVTLLNSDGSWVDETASPDKNGVLSLRDLRLAPGDYDIRLGSMADGVAATLSASVDSPPPGNIAAEPDDRMTTAHELGVGATATGRLLAPESSQDTDTYVVTVDATLAAQDLDLSVRVPGRDDITLTLSDGTGQAIFERHGPGGVRSGKLALTEGKYFVAVKGRLAESQTYSLGLSADVRPAGQGEQEPNDIAARATPVIAGEVVRGSFVGTDRDYLLLHVTGDVQMWNISVTSKALYAVRLMDPTGAEVASGLAFSDDTTIKLSRLLLAPGDHLLKLDSKPDVAPTDWVLRSTALGVPRAGDEVEPNDTQEDANILDVGNPNTFWLDHTGDIDLATFSIDAAYRVSLTMDGPAGVSPRLRMAWDGSYLENFDPSSDTGDDGRSRLAWDGLLQPGEYTLQLVANEGKSRYPIEISAKLSPPFDVVPDAQTPVMGLELPANPVAAYSQDGQVLPGHLRINARPGPTSTYALLPWTGDERWQIVGLPAEVTVSGSDQELPFQLIIPPDAKDTRPTPIAIALKQGEAVKVIATSTVTALIGATQIAPLRQSTLGPVLEGGFNVAWSALGATTDATYLPLIDGLADNTAVRLPPEGVTIDLAGDDPVPVRGFSLLPTSVSAATSRQWAFTFELSTDGIDFSPALEGITSPIAREQAFELPVAIPARFARIVPHFASGNASPEATLGTFVVIAEPGALTLPIDLARLDLGGHIVYTSPQTDPVVTGEQAAWPAGYAVTFVKGSMGQGSFVMAFGHDRAAKITDITSSLRDDVPAESLITSLIVEAATVSPFGPWTRLGTLDFAAEPGAKTTLALPDAPVVRYLRFATEVPDADLAALPASMTISEAPATADWPSAVGEWGAFSSSGPYEKQSYAAEPRPNAPSGGASRDTAAPLAEGQETTGIATRNVRSDWYRVDLAPDTRSLKLSLGGYPTVEASVALFDATGSAVRLSPAGDYGTYQAEVSGGSYFVEVSQQPQSIIVAWDTSSSVAEYSRTIVRVVKQLANDISAAGGGLGFVPFRGDATALLEPGFVDATAEAWRVVQTYGWADSDSDSERAQIIAAKALAARQGARAIVLLTDASSPGATHNAELWDALNAARPVVFALHIASGEVDERGRRQTELMQDWAASSDGAYQLLSSTSDAALSFRRLAARLAAPAAYRLSYSTSAEPPLPGQLQVSSLAPGSEAASPLAARDSYAIVVDASGSMLQRLNGKRKIEVAKAALAELIGTTMPEGVETSLRVFGQGGKGSCASDLLLARAPLDRAAALEAINSIRSTNGSKTPIAESLRLAADDLAGTEGRRWIILITDGEETCGGDPAAVIADLKARGIDIHLNIVGFSVDDPTVRTSFENWAAVGGGSYFDATDVATLGPSIAAALATRFDVVAPDGAVVATGVVGGEPLTLPAGDYGIRPSGEAQTPLTRVSIRSNMLTAATLPSMDQPRSSP